MILLLLRHGQTLFNELGYTQGWYDSQLTELGKKQAIQAGMNLKEEKIDYAYSSYSERAYDTCELALFNRKIEIIRDKRIKEMNFGVFEGNPDTLFRTATKKQWEDGMFDFTNFDGENKEQVVQRQLQFLDELKNKHSDDTILISGHGISLMLLYQAIAGESMKNYDPKYQMPKNCDVIKIEYNGLKSKILHIYRNELS